MAEVLPNFFHRSDGGRGEDMIQFVRWDGTLEILVGNTETSPGWRSPSKTTAKVFSHVGRDCSVCRLRKRLKI